MSFRKTMKAKTVKALRGSVKRVLGDDPAPRKSLRIAGRDPMRRVQLGVGIRGVSDEQIQDFVNDEIEPNIPQIVDIPTPPERHAFLVDVQVSNGQIMVSEWGGQGNEMRGVSKGRQIADPSFVIYSKLLQLLSAKYNMPIKYYPVDNKLYVEADNHHKECNGHGGCSHYIYKWTKEYYPDYAV